MNKESTYFRNGKLIAKSGDVRVYTMDNELFLEDGRMNLVSSDSKKGDYIWQISGKPKGNCLVIGLGLGTIVSYILSLNKVSSLTIIEENKDIISVVNKLNKFEGLFEIICIDYLSYLYKNNTKYDFIFIDCYTKIDETTLPYIADIVVASKLNLKSGGVLLGWFDIRTSERFVDSFYNLFNTI